MSQAALSSELQASVDEFMRGGGKITQLSWAGVPVDGSAIEPKPVRAFGRFYPAPAAPAPEVVAETVAEWCNRVAPPDTAPAAPAAPTVADICEHFGVPVDAQALADYTADMRPQQEAHVIRQLRRLRADARRVLASLDNLERP